MRLETCSTANPADLHKPVCCPLPIQTGGASPVSFWMAVIYTFLMPPLALYGSTPARKLFFVDRPYFFFGQQTPTQDVIDFLVTGDEMYLLHADGRISNCFFSRVDTATSKCQDPLVRVNPFPAYSDMDLFSTAHFTQILFAAPPDPSMLLLIRMDKALCASPRARWNYKTNFSPHQMETPFHADL